MTKRVVQLSPSIPKPVPKPVPPQCDMVVEDMWSPGSQFYTKYRLDKAKRSGRDPKRCQKTSKYRIDDENLCAFHAGRRALEILEKELK